jgi:hypothetical protein
VDGFSAAELMRLAIYEIMCQKFLANSLRVIFSALAYTLMQRLREIALAARVRQFSRSIFIIRNPMAENTTG